MPEVALFPLSVASYACQLFPLASYSILENVMNLPHGQSPLAPHCVFSSLSNIWFWRWLRHDVDHRQAWCYVDPCECQLAVPPKTSSYLPSGKANGRLILLSMSEQGWTGWVGGYREGHGFKDAGRKGG